MKHQLYLVIISLIVCIGCNQLNSRQKEDPSDNKPKNDSIIRIETTSHFEGTNFKHPNLEFSIKIPKGWKEIEQESGADFIAHDAFVNTIIIKTQKLPKDYYSSIFEELNQFSDIEIENSFTSVSGAKLIERSRVNFSNTDWYYLKLKEGTGKNLDIDNIYLTYHNGLIYTIIMTTRMSMESETLPAFNQIIATFKF